MSLRVLDYIPYSEYLSSEHWQTIRARALAAADNQCRNCCTAGSLTVHHKSYNLGYEQLEDLEVLCLTCHTIEHSAKEVVHAF